MLKHLFFHLILSSRAGSLIRRIAALSSFAIALSVFAFLIVLFVMNGMNASIRERLMGLEPHLVLQADGIRTAKEVSELKVVRELKKQPDVQTAIFESQDVILRTLDGQFRGATARGLDESSLRQFLQEIRRVKVSAPRVLSLDGSNEISTEEPPGEGEVLIGIDLARSLGVFEGDQLLVLSPESLLLPPGESPKIERVKIRRIVSANVSDLDAKLFLYVRGSALRSLANSPALKVGIELRLPHGEDADAWKKNFGEHDKIHVETWSERNSALFFALRLEKSMIALFLGLAGLIAGSSILTVMALLVSQKRRDIALLRVLGISADEAVKLFTKMGMLLAGGAILIGVIGGSGLGLWVQAHPLNVLPDIYYDSEIPSRFDGWLALLTLAVAMGLAFLGAWIPSRSVAEIEPTQVLRQKN